MRKNKQITAQKHQMKQDETFCGKRSVLCFAMNNDKLRCYCLFMWVAYADQTWWSPSVITGTLRGAHVVLFFACTNPHYSV